MKKTLVILLIPAFFILFSLDCFCVSPEEAFSELVQAIPEDIKNSLPEGTADEMLSGETGSKKLNAPFFLGLAGSALKFAVGDSLSCFLAVTGMIILSSLLVSLGNSAGQDLKGICRFTGGICTVSVVLATVIPLKDYVCSAIFGIGTAVKSAIPAMTLLCAASGGASEAATGSMWLTAFLTLTEQLAETILSPAVFVLLGFAALIPFSEMTGALDLTGIRNGIKKLFLTSLTLISAILSAVMAYQTVIAKRSDTLLLRSIKFASGNMIPVVGGSISEAAGNYLAAASMIKASAGTLTTVCLIVYLIPVFVKLIVFRFVMSAGSAAASIFGCRSESAFLAECGEIIGLLLGTVSIISVVFITVIAVLSAF